MFHQQGILAAGTNKGHVAMWKYNVSRSMTSSKDTPWELLAPSELFSESITAIQVGTVSSIMISKIFTI